MQTCSAKCGIHIDANKPGKWYLGWIMKHAARHINLDDSIKTLRMICKAEYKKNILGPTGCIRNGSSEWSICNHHFHVVMRYDDTTREVVCVMNDYSYNIFQIITSIERLMKLKWVKKTRAICIILNHKIINGSRNLAHITALHKEK